MAAKRTKKAIRGKGEGGLYQRASDGMWCAAVELPPGDDGRRRRRVICRKDKAAARDALREAQDQLAEQGDIVVSGGTTLEKWLLYWLEEIAPKNIRPNTLNGYASSFTNHVIPAIGRHPLNKLSPQHVREMHKRMAVTPADPRVRRLPRDEWPEDPAMLSSTTILLAHNALSVALKTAKREGRIRNNPCDNVDKPRKGLSEQHSLTVDESIQLLAYCATIPDGPLWAAFLLTGARRGELIGLEPDRVADTLDLSWQIQRVKDITKAPADYEYRHITGTLYLTRPKSSSGWRVLPLVEPLHSIIKLAVQTGQSGFVFNEWAQIDAKEGAEKVWVNTGRPWDPSRATKRWKAVLKAAGLPENVVLHGARHTTVDLLDAAGVPHQVIQDIVGHSSVLTTRKYRTRVDMERLKAALGDMGKMLGS